MNCSKNARVIVDNKVACFLGMVVSYDTTMAYCHMV